MQHFRIKLSLFLNYFVFAILLNSIGVIISLSKTYFGVNNKQASYLDPFKDISIAVASFFVGAFISRIGYKKSMLTALLMVAAACFIIPSVKTFIAVKVLCSTVGFAFGLTKVSVFGTIGLVTNSEKEHLSLMNFIESFFMIGVLSGYYLFAAFSNNPETGNWFNTYYIVGGISLVAFIFLLSAKLDESVIKNQKASSAGEDMGEMLKLIAIPLVVSFVLCAFFYVLIEQSTMNWLPSFNKDVLKINQQLAIVLGSILSGTIALGRFLAGVVLKKLNWFVVLLGCLAGATIILSLSLYLAGRTDTAKEISSFRDIPLVAFVFPTIGLFLAPIYPAINSVILGSLPKKRHAAMSGLIVVFSAIGGTLGSIVTGYLFDSEGGIKAFYFSFIPIAILFVSIIVFRRLRYRNQKTTVGSGTINELENH